jgi:hypothetical protein
MKILEFFYYCVCGYQREFNDEDTIQYRYFYLSFYWKFITNIIIILYKPKLVFYILFDYLHGCILYYQNRNHEELPIDQRTYNQNLKHLIGVRQIISINILLLVMTILYTVIQNSIIYYCWIALFIIYILFHLYWCFTLTFLICLFQLSTMIIDVYAIIVTYINNR